MSNALALAATSAVLQSLLNTVFSAAGLGSVIVTAVAPDLVQTSRSGSAGLQVNLFLHQVTPNAAWRNADLPSLAADGQTRLRNRPLALDLHYLLTAYGTNDFEAEALLGFAVQFLHETPVLARGEIQSVLDSALATGSTSAGQTFGNTTLNALLNGTGLADQVELLKVTPATLGREEVAWLWTALKADYRPTFPFQVTVVLIQAQNAATAPLPVTSRKLTIQAGLLSSLLSVAPPAGQAGACLGDMVTVTGLGLANAVTVTLSNSYLGIQYPGPGDPPIKPAAVTDTSLQFIVPMSTNPARLPAGVYMISVQVQAPPVPAPSVPPPPPTSSNGLPLAIAPRITLTPPPSVTGPSFPLTPNCTPSVLPRQQVSLILGNQEVVATPFQSATATPSFSFTNVAAGTYFVRLRVDGVDSPIVYATPGGTTPPVAASPTITVK